MHRWSSVILAAWLAVSVAGACAAPQAGQLGSETNWLGHCESNADCRKGTCVCGTCTTACTSNTGCGPGICIRRGTAAYSSLCAAEDDAPSALCALAESTLSTPDAAMLRSDAAIPIPDAATPIPDAAMPIPDAHATPIPDARATATGSDTKDAGVCTVANLVSSEDALAAVQNSPDLPGAARLVSIRSSSLGDLSPDGKARWNIMYDSGNRAESFAVCTPRSIVHSSAALDPNPPCDGQQVQPVPSSAVVPDAVARVAALATYDTTDLFFDQSVTCGPDESDRVVTVHGQRSADGGTLSERWFAHYAADGVLARLCGPCGDVSAPDCTTCTGGPATPLSLTMGRAGSTATFGCLTYKQGVIGQSTTTLDDAGQLTNADCALAMVQLDDGPYFLAGPTLDIELRTPDFDNDSVRHSSSTAEDHVTNGTFAMSFFALDGFETRALWSGELFVGSVDNEKHTAWLAATKSP